MAACQLSLWAAAKPAGAWRRRWRCCRCGTVRGPAAAAEAARTTLPRNREATADEKKRAAVIYADALVRALRQPHQQGGRGGGRA